MSTETLDRVAVVAGAQTAWRPAWSGLQHVELIGRAVTGALKGSGLRMEDVDVVIDCGSDVLDGRSISNCGFLGAMGGHHKEESRVEEDGLFGVVYAATKIACGSARVALVVAYSKPSESSLSAYYSTLAEPFYQRPVGLDHVSVAGLLASQYLSTTDASEEDLLTIASRAWERGARNRSIEAPTYGAQDVRSAEMVADPLTLLQISRPVDGAVAVLLAAESVARKVTERPVWITGMGSAMDSQYLAERTPGRMDAAAAAGDRALRQAGITDRSSIGLAEVSGTSAPAEAMVVEALGFAPHGRAVDAYADEAPLEINPSGGALPADPVMATGLVRLHEAAERLSGRGPQGTKATRALVHGAGGLGMQNHCVLTVEV